MLVNFSKKFPFGGKGNLGPIWAKTMQSCLMIFSLIIFFKMQYDRTQWVDNSNRQFSQKNISLGKWTVGTQFEPKLCNLMSNDQLEGFD